MSNIRRQGARRSTKTLYYAAYKGRKLQVIWPVGEPPWATITGYLVGMDDFYLEIVEVPPFPDDEFEIPVTVSVVHKSAPLVRILGTETLETESSRIRDEITKLGRSFWDTCRRVHSGQNQQQDAKES